MDEKGLFAVHTYNPNGKWDWYEIGGRWDGFLRGNAMIARTLRRQPNLKKLLPHDFVTPDGEWHEEETWHPAGYLGGTFSHKSQSIWLKEFTLALANWPHDRVVCVDRHS